MWRAQFIKNLVKTNKSLGIMYKKYGYYPTLKLPEKLETDEEILRFAREIRDAIERPELSYLRKNK
jgi:hypothetical protein